MPWKNADGLSIYFATFLRLLKIVEYKQAVAFVWPEEGEFDKHAVFHFNSDHNGFEPLIIDLTTAHAMVTVYGALNEQKNKKMFRDWTAKSRGHFGKLVEFTWDHVSFGGKK